MKRHSLKAENVRTFLQAENPKTFYNFIKNVIAELNIERYTDPKEEDIFGCFVTEIEEEGVVFAIVQGENGEETTASTENRNNFRTIRDKFAI